MRVLTIAAAAVVAAIFANHAHAQNSIAWDTGYPKKGIVEGDIKVSGRIKVDIADGWSLKILKDNVTVQYWQDGYLVYRTTLTAQQAKDKDGKVIPGEYTFSGTLKLLAREATYNITAEVQISHATLGDRLIRTKPGRSMPF